MLLDGQMVEILYLIENNSYHFDLKALYALKFDSHPRDNVEGKLNAMTLLD